MCASSSPIDSQRAPLRGARRPEHLGAQVPGQLHRGHAHAAGRGVHQQPLAPLQARPGRPARSRPSGTPPEPTRPRRTTSPRAPARAPCGRPPPPGRTLRAACPSRGRRAAGRSPPGPTSSTTPAPSLPIASHAPRRGTCRGRSATSRKFKPAARTATRTCPSASGSSTSGHPTRRRSSSVPLPPPARRHRATPSGGASTPAPPACASRGASTTPSRTASCSPVSAGSLLASAAASARHDAASPSRSTSTKRPGCSDWAERTQAPHRRRRQARDLLARVHRHRALGEHHQARSGQPLLREPRLHERERLKRGLVRALGNALARRLLGRAPAQLPM